MTNPISTEKETTAGGVSPGLWAWGARSWLYLGIALWAFVIVLFLSLMPGLVIPLVVAIVMAMLFYPLVDIMAARRVNRTFGSLLVLLLVMVVAIGTIWIMWAGIVSQSDEMLAHIEAGLVALSSQGNLPLPDDLTGQVMETVQTALPQSISGITSFLISSFSGFVTFLMGGYTALFLLYYLLSDWHNVSDWVGRHIGAPVELGISLVSDATSAVRVYFYALTLANLPVAIAVGVTMWLLGLPLAVPVALVTMITAYIPYLGAVISGTFAALVALGAGGVTDAVIILVVIFGLQNIVDPIITNYMASDKLEMHPIVTLVSTLAGGILFGALGATLASPLTAVLIGARKEVQVYQAKQQAEDNHKENI
jgi:predicted PurR-regulated permease PerM